MCTPTIRKSNTKRKRIYVADDDESILELLKMILEWDGFDVITSSDGLSLMYLKEPPDLVFLDVSMKVSDGSQICDQYKKNPDTSSVPVVLISADPSLLEKAANCGADGVLHKPFDIKSITGITHHYIDQ